MLSRPFWIGRQLVDVSKAKNICTFSTLASNYHALFCSRPFAWGRILGRNPDKILKSFPPCYSQSPLYSFVLRFLFLQTHATSYNFYSSVMRKSQWKPYPLPYGLRNPYRTRKIMPGNLTKLYVHDFGFWLFKYPDNPDTFPQSFPVSLSTSCLSGNTCPYAVPVSYFVLVSYAVFWMMRNWSESIDKEDAGLMPESVDKDIRNSTC